MIDTEILSENIKKSLSEADSLIINCTAIELFEPLFTELRTVAGWSWLKETTALPNGLIQGSEKRIKIEIEESVVRTENWALLRVIKQGGSTTEIILQNILGQIVDQYALIDGKTTMRLAEKQVNHEIQKDIELNDYRDSAIL